MSAKPYVMVIEDAAELAGIFVEILELKGMMVELIMDGAVAMERLSQVIPDLVLLDIHLPTVSGLEILEYMRKTPGLKNAKIVAITANALLKDELMQKADILWIKPVTFVQISELATMLTKDIQSKHDNPPQ